MLKRLSITLFGACLCGLLLIGYNLGKVKGMEKAMKELRDEPKTEQTAHVKELPITLYVNGEQVTKESVEESLRELLK